MFFRCETLGLFFAVVMVLSGFCHSLYGSVGMEVDGDAILSTADTIALVPLDSGQVAGQIPMWDGEQWVLVNPGVQGDQFKVDSVGTPSWESSGSPEGFDVGCLDPGACNYMPAAAISFPGMCDYLSCKGCTDEQYLEYSEQALIDDGSCATKLGCLDPDADNFDPEASVNDASCSYSRIYLERWDEGTVTANSPVLFTLHLSDADSLYSDIRFYRNGEESGEQVGEYWSCSSGVSDFTVYASAMYEGDTLYSDTMAVAVYFQEGSIPIVVDLPLDQMEQLGTGVCIHSSIDSVIAGWDMLSSGALPDLMCDFSDGTENVVGVLTGLEQDTIFTLGFAAIEPWDTLTLSLKQSATVLARLFMDEESTSVNFIEENIESTSHYDSLYSTLSSDLIAHGYLDVSTDVVLLVDTIAAELSSMLPVAAGQINDPACPLSSYYSPANGLRDWPVLSTLENGNLKWENCGVDLHYGVKAITKLIDGDLLESKTHVFRPELATAGRLTLFTYLNQSSFPDEYRFRGVFLEDSELEPWELLPGGGKHGSTSILVVREGGGDGFTYAAEPPIPFGWEFVWHFMDGAFPGFLFKTQCWDEFPPAIVDWGQEWWLSRPEAMKSLEEEGLFGSEWVELAKNHTVNRLDDLAERILVAGGSCLGDLVTSWVQLQLWLKVNEVSQWKPAVTLGMAEVGSFVVDLAYAESYVCRQTLMEGKFWGTYAFDHAEQPVNPNSNPFYTDQAPLGAEIYTEEDLADNSFAHLYRGWNRARTPVQSGIGHLGVARLGAGLKRYSFFAFRPTGSVLHHIEAPLVEPPSLSMLSVLFTGSASDDFSYHPPVVDLDGEAFLGHFPNFDFVELGHPDCQWPGFEVENIPDFASHMGDLYDVAFTGDNPENRAFLSYAYHQGQHQRVPYSIHFSNYPEGLTCTNVHPSAQVHGTMKTGTAPFVRGLGNSLNLLGDLCSFTCLADSAGFYTSENEEFQYAPLPDVPNVLAGDQTIADAPVLGSPLTEWRGVYTPNVEFSWVGEGLERLLRHESLMEEVERSDDGLFSLSIPDENYGLGYVQISAASGVCGDLSFEVPDGAQFNELLLENASLLEYSLPLQGSPPVMKLDLSDESESVIDSPCTLKVTLSRDTQFSQLLGEWSIAVTSQSSPCQGDSILNYAGYDYSIVEIGDQCWFAENLRTTVYGNGDVIPAGLTDGEWTSTFAGATAVYGEGTISCYNNNPDIDACDEAQSLAAYGRLYNYYAVVDVRGLCPSGWHVPTDGEWTELEDYITSQGFAGTEGTALKSTSGWYNNFNGTDDFGFSALPGGYRGDIIGLFGLNGTDCFWWSSSPNGGEAWHRHLYSSIPVIYRESDDPRGGFSVRCLRDGE